MTATDPNFISQRTIFGGPKFRFLDDHLEYSGIDWDMRVKYEDIAPVIQYRQSRKEGRAVGFVVIYFILVALALLWRDPTPHYGAEGFGWLLRSGGIFVVALLAVCVPLYYATKKEYTIIPTRNGTMYVAMGKQHDAIISRLQTRRLQSLRRFAAPEPANSPEEEFNKLKWLCDEGAITKEEFARLGANVEPGAA